MNVSHGNSTSQPSSAVGSIRSVHRSELTSLSPPRGKLHMQYICSIKYIYMCSRVQPTRSRSVRKLLRRRTHALM